MRMLGSLFALGLALMPAVAHAEPAWSGDFETGDLAQWNYLLNPTINRVDYITLEEGEVAQGDYAARIELHNDAVWGNGLKRVEMQHLLPTLLKNGVLVLPLMLVHGHQVEI